MQIVRAFAFAVFVVVALPCRTSGQEVSAEESLARYRLLTKCEPVTLLVEEVSDAAKAISLTRQRIYSMAESRMRAARMYTDDVDQLIMHGYALHISIIVNQTAFSLDLQFLKWLTDPTSEQSHLAATWETGFLAMHGGNAAIIMQLLSERLDRFILEYLRVNEAFCEA